MCELLCGARAVCTCIQMHTCVVRNAGAPCAVCECGGAAHWHLVDVRGVCHAVTWQYLCEGGAVCQCAQRLSVFTVYNWKPL